MIKGIGTDIVNIERIEKLCKNELFLKRCFSDKEILYINKKHNCSKTVAGMYAAKEAVSKALGTGLREFGFLNIEIFHDYLGKPMINLNGNARSILETIKGKDIFISISHDTDYAVAYCIIEALES